jgi:hypothetical protein
VKKSCSICKVEKDPSHFYKKTEHTDGLDSRCKCCERSRKTKSYIIRGDTIRRQTLEYYRKNKDALYISRKKRFDERIKTDLGFKLQKRLRTRLWHALKSNQKSGSAVRDLGCSIAELKLYLESKFKPGMSWDNYGILII